MKPQEYFDHPYWGSTDLKGYLKSPKLALWQKSQVSEPSTSQSFGTLLHEFLECKVKRLTFHYDIVDPLINPKTGLPYGPDIEKQKAHFASFSNPILRTDYEKILSIFCDLDTDPIIYKWLYFSDMQSESQYFDETDQTKWMPDIVNDKVIVDWKTTNDLSFKGIRQAIFQYGYDFSACHYQAKEFNRTGIMKKFFWVFISNVEPFDHLIVSANEMCFDLQDGVIILNDSAYKYQKIMKLHQQCIENNEWPGLASMVQENWKGQKIYLPISKNEVI